jgi:hypothetical protein
MNKHDIIEEYYRAFRDRDQEALRSILTPSFHHISSFAEYTNRDDMLQAIWPMVGQSWARGLSIFGEGLDFMVRYEIESRERAPVTMAEYIRFEGDRIAEIEVYVGRQLGD